MILNNYGGKANSLIKVRDGGFNVPKFFILSSEDFEEFLDFNNLRKLIEVLFKDKKYSEIKKCILNAEFPDSLKKKIEEKYNELDSDILSVRSSAFNEDGVSKSFTGQYKSILNVTFDNLYQSIKECWCSLYEENVLVYSDKDDLFGMNLVIQSMIISDYAGVAFSLDVTSETGNYSLIEIVKGSGENLVCFQDNSYKVTC